jgi:hypothetical protein
VLPGSCLPVHGSPDLCSQAHSLAWRRPVPKPLPALHAAANIANLVARFERQSDSDPQAQAQPQAGGSRSTSPDNPSWGFSAAPAAPATGRPSFDTKAQQASRAQAGGAATTSSRSAAAGSGRAPAAKVQRHPGAPLLPPQLLEAAGASASAPAPGGSGTTAGDLRQVNLRLSQELLMGLVRQNRAAPFGEPPATGPQHPSQAAPAPAGPAAEPLGLQGGGRRGCATLLCGSLS